MNFGTIISKHRRSIMGLAALMILCFHSLWKPDFLPWKILINRYGNAGVDFFVFLAGFGIAFSLEKSPDFYRYYIRRLERILPSYYAAITIIMLLYLFLGKFTLTWFLQSYIPIGVWANAVPQFWYVSATLGYYLIAPLFFNLFKISRFPRFTLLILLVITGILVPMISELDSQPIMRFPALVTGIAMGVFQTCHGLKKDRWIDFLILAVCFAMGLLIYTDSFILDLPLFSLIRYGYKNRLWRALTAPFSVVIAAYCFEALEKTPVRFLNHLFDRLGIYSLELYMGHLMVKASVSAMVELSPAGHLIAMLVFSYPVAVLLSKVGDRFLCLIKKLPASKAAKHQ